MKRQFSTTLLCFCFILFSVSCKKDEIIPGPGTLILEFDNVVGDANLELNTATTPYSNSKGEAFKITGLRYYVTAIQLKKSDGTVYADEVKPDGSAGYYLIDEEDAESHEVTLKNIPPGDYTDVTFTVGIDADQVDHGTPTGALDPAKGLFVSWDSGYIFMAVDGASPVSAEANDAFEYHVGGYKEVPGNANLVNNINTIVLSFNGSKATVEAGHEPEVHLLYDVKKFFDGPGGQVTFSANAMRQIPKDCADLAKNLTGAFTVDHVHAN